MSAIWFFLWYPLILLNIGSVLLWLYLSGKWWRVNNFTRQASEGKRLAFVHQWYRRKERAVFATQNCTGYRSDECDAERSFERIPYYRYRRCTQWVFADTGKQVSNTLCATLHLHQIKMHEWAKQEAKIEEFRKAFIE